MCTLTGVCVLLCLQVSSHPSCSVCMCPLTLFPLHLSLGAPHLRQPYAHTISLCCSLGYQAGKDPKTFSCACYKNCTCTFKHGYPTHESYHAVESSLLLVQIPNDPLVLIVLIVLSQRSAESALFTGTALYLDVAASETPPHPSTSTHSPRRRGRGHGTMFHPLTLAAIGQAFGQVLLQLHNPRMGGRQRGAQDAKKEQGSHRPEVCLWQ